MMPNTSNSVEQMSKSGATAIGQHCSDKSGKLNRVQRFEIEAVPHFAYMKRLAMRFVRNQTEAEDLVQETFTQALKSFDTYQSGTNCRAWLSKIMNHLYFHWIRRNVRYCQIDEWKESSATMSTYSVASPTEYLSKEMASSLSSLLITFQQVVWLAEVEGFTYQEIADRLNIPIGTVMSRLSRGRQKLRLKFAYYTEQSGSEVKNRH
jgi:RNA polymerase sigma-70 factor, ECF subfamily